MHVLHSWLSSLETSQQEAFRATGVWKRIFIQTLFNGEWFAVFGCYPHYKLLYITIVFANLFHGTKKCDLCAFFGHGAFCHRRRVLLSLIPPSHFRYCVSWKS